MIKAVIINDEKPIISTEMARYRADVWTLVAHISDGLSELAESEADSNGNGMYFPNELLRAVKSLSASLHAMFDAEGCGQGRSAVLTENPHLTEQLNTLHHEHLHLAAMITTFEELCDDDEPLASWTDVERRFRDFASALTSHERRETMLLQDAVTTDIGLGD